MTPARDTLRTILVGTDYSENAEVAIAEGLRLAAAHGARLVVAHALSPPEPPVMFEGGRNYYLKLLRDQIASVRAQLESTERAVCVETSAEVVEGFAPGRLSHLARDLGADLLVVATHGRTGFRRLLLGSVAEKIVRVSETDTLIARRRPNPELGFRRLLVPSDFSESSERALERAIALAAPGGTVEVFHAWQLPDLLPPAPREAGAEDSARRAELRAEVERAGEALVTRRRVEGVELSFAHRCDAPVRAIQTRLDEQPFDLVVVGSHGRRGFERVILGSVAEATVRYAPCSVLVVRKPIASRSMRDASTGAAASTSGESDAPR